MEGRISVNPTFSAFSADPTSTPACGGVWHHRSASTSYRGRAIRAALDPCRTMRGFFALAASTSVLRVTSVPLSRRRGHSLPAPIGWGSNRITGASDTRCHAPSVESSSTCFPCLGAPGRRRSRMGLAPAMTSTRVPSIGEDSAAQGSPFSFDIARRSGPCGAVTRTTRALRSPFCGGPASSLRRARGRSPD